MENHPGTVYAGVEYRYACFCGDASRSQYFAENEVDESECDMTCTGDDSLTCGGGSRINVYFTDLPPIHYNSIGEELTQNDIRYSGLTVYPEYEVSIDLNLSGASCGGHYCNVFGFGVDGVPSNQRGSRVPAVWLLPGNTRMHICRTDNASHHHCWDSEAMPTGVWFNLRISQALHGGQILYKVFMNDE